MLVFLGDFIDGASDSLEVLRLVKRLCDEHPGRVVAIKGNHEERMAGWLDGREAGPAWLGSPKTDATLRSLLAPEQYEQVMETLVHGRSAQEMQDIRTDDPAYRVACGLARSYLRDNHAELVEWLVGLPYHFETERQIFVHAGVQEAAGTRWEQRTPAMWFANKYPPSRGHFYKDVVAGHISTAQIAKDPALPQRLLGRGEPLLHRRGRSSKPCGPRAQVRRRQRGVHQLLARLRHRTRRRRARRGPRRACVCGHGARRRRVSK